MDVPLYIPNNNKDDVLLDASTNNKDKGDTLMYTPDNNNEEDVLLIDGSNNRDKINVMLVWSYNNILLMILNNAEIYRSWMYNTFLDREVSIVIMIIIIVTFD